MTHSTIKLTDLDFNTLKENFKTFLKGQPVFKDYDFDGSNINVLLDLLAYNTFQNGFYLNMLASEAFLDSAQMRESVISHAKELNYVPRSSRSARANVNILFTANTNVVTIPKDTSFTTTVGNKLYSFLTQETTVHFSSDLTEYKTFNATNLEIYEGEKITDRYVVNYDDPTQRFLISDPRVDTRSINVYVYEGGENDTLNYKAATTLLDLDYNSVVYFLQAAEKGKYEIIFGDDVIGRRPADSAIVEIEYRATNGPAGNGAYKFFLDSDFTGGRFGSTPVVSTNELASGGAEPEDLSSIKYYAPRHFQVQERAINTSDYEVMLKQKFPEITTISAYGGEELSPPMYGKVYIAVDISDIDGLPQSKIQEYTQFLKPRSPLSIDPVFVEPDYLYYSVNTNVKYNVNSTNLKPEQIKSLVINQILNYNEHYLSDFKSPFRYSKLIRAIDDADALSVISNETDIKIYKKLTPALRATQNIALTFDIALTKSVSKIGTQYDDDDMVTVFTSEYILNGERVRIHDDGNGILRVVKLVNNKYIVVIPNIGTVDYDTGIIKFVNFRIDAYLGNAFKLYAITRNKDFDSAKNVILTLEPSEINVSVTPIRDLIGNISHTTQRE